MKEKDEKLQRIFDDLGDSISPISDISQRVRQSLEHSAAPVRKSPVRPWAIALCCAFLAVFVMGGTVFGVIAGQDRLSSSAVVYDRSQLSGNPISKAEASKIISTTKLENGGYSVISETYYAYYFKETDDLAYVRGRLYISTEKGTVELEIIAESNKYVKADFQKVYDSYINKPDSIGDLACDSSCAGEYVTSSFIHAEELHFYVFSQGNPATSTEVNKIITLLFDQKGKGGE